MPPPKRVYPDEDDDEYLDELASDDEGDVKPLRGTNDAGTLLKGSLHPPRHTTVSIRQLHDMIHFGDVDLDPAYQREVVWSEIKMIGLIQSLFLNYHIPPVIWSVTEDEAQGQQAYTCIDGKQRCTSILKFMDGQIPFVSPHTHQKFWFSKYGNRKSGRQLPEHLKRRFEQIQIQAVEYRDIRDDQQRDIFQRVQMGMPLSAAEKLQAIPSPWTTWILQLLKKYIIEEGALAGRIQMDVSRGRSFQGLTAVVMLCHDPSKVLQPTAPSMHTFLSRSDPPDQNFKRRLEMALSIFINIAENRHATAFGNITARVAPVEFWYISLLIYSRMGNLSVESLAEKISQMRQHIRNEFIDIRSNAKVMSSLRQWLNQQPKKRTHEEVAAAEEYEGDEDVDQRDQRALKRARKAEDADPTYRGTAVERGTESAPGGATRSRVAAPVPNNTGTTSGNLAPSTFENKTAVKAPVPVHTVARPPPTSMDRQGGRVELSPTFGQLPAPQAQVQSDVAGQGAVNSYTADYNRWQPPQAPQPDPTPTPGQYAHFNAIAQSQANAQRNGGQQNRWQR